MIKINRNKESSLTYDRLVELLDYCPDTGIFTWRKARGPRPAGGFAGNIQPNGYHQIRLDNRLYLGHRLAWFYYYREWPDILDHIDRDTLNNAINNLREVTQAENTYNTGLSSHNTSGYKGVSYNKSRNKYEAYISINNKKKSLGLYNSAEEAYQMYLDAVDTLRNIGLKR